MSDTGRVHAIKMPKWGLSMQEGTLVSWRVQLGDRIAVGAPLCDIETAKIANEFDSPAAGVVVRLLAAADEIVPVGKLIAIVAEDNAASGEIDAIVAHEASGTAPRHTAEEAPRVQHIGPGASALAYLEAGSGPGPAIVLLHGFGGNHASWAVSQAELAERHRTVAFDLPGHGASGPGAGEGTSGEMAEMLAAALDTLRLARVHLVGHSFGGRVALHLIARCRPRIAYATFIAPLGFGSCANPEFVQGFVESERKRDLKPILEMLFADPAMLSRDMVGDALRLLRHEPSRAMLRKIAAAMLAEPPGEAPPPELEGLEYQVIWGERDRIISAPPALGARLGHRLHLLRDAGHMPQLERAARVNQLIADVIPE